MQKFLITPKSHNRVTGPIMVTTSPRKTCPVACPLRKHSGAASEGGCYAEHGFLGGFIWTKLDRLAPGATFKAGQIRVQSQQDLLRAIRVLPEGSLWRHNQAGDLHSEDQVNICENSLEQIVAANRGRRGFTYTHYDARRNTRNRRLVRRANRSGFTVNLSANSLDEADQLAQLDAGPIAVVLPSGQRHNTVTKSGHKVIICPAVKTPGAITCASCGICAKQRKAIVGLPAVGAGARSAERAASTRSRRR